MRTITHFFSAVASLLILSSCYNSEAKEQFNATIPLVDMNDYHNPETRERFIKGVSDALREVGFFAVINTGVDEEALDSAYSTAENFYRLPYAIKSRYYNPAINGQRGYVPGESAKGQAESDFKEFYHVGREQTDDTSKHLGYAHNIWPEEINLKDPLVTLYQALEKHMTPIQEAMALGIDQPKDFFIDKTTNGNTLLRSIHYPANPPSNQLWAAEHTDTGLFTILPRATADGLQVKNKQGEWITVKVPKNAFVINGADHLENLTNGEYRSGPHRVVSLGDNYERYSMVLFVHPRGDTDVSPTYTSIRRTGGSQRYPSATAWELLSERLADLGLASTSMLKELSASGLLEKQIDLGRASPEAMLAVYKAGFASEKVQNELKKLGY